MKTILLNISDIHIGSETPENEVLVLNSFLKDVEDKSVNYGMIKFMFS